MDAMNATDNDRCTVCRARFRSDDAIGMLADHVVHSRCVPKTPRFTDEELEDDEES